MEPPLRPSIDGAVEHEIGRSAAPSARSARETRDQKEQQGK
jgi:hypothetical protein